MSHMGVKILARAVGVAVGRRSGAQLATTLLDHYFYHSWHERSALQSVAAPLGGWLAMTLVATILTVIFFSRFFPVSSVITILKEGVFG